MYIEREMYIHFFLSIIITTMTITCYVNHAGADDLGKPDSQSENRNPGVSPEPISISRGN